MNDVDPVLQALARLPLEAPPAALSRRLQAAAHAKLRPRGLHPAWGVVVAASVVVYLGWALAFTGRL